LEYEERKSNEKQIQAPQGRCVGFNLWPNLVGQQRNNAKGVQSPCRRNESILFRFDVSMSDFSFMGSGVYSVEVDREIICAERCGDCEDNGQRCDAIWDEGLMTDDWGNIDQEVECPTCKHKFNFREEKE
jgi:hypothetical protein